MVTATMKYNPAFLDDEALTAAFAVRGRDLATILEIVAENTGASNQHIMVLGPRGVGKTTLALRVAAELRRTRAAYPIVFAEESYEVHDAATLWLQALFHLGRQTGEARWQAAYEQLRGETDAERVRILALAELHEFSEAQGQRILLVVENFNVLVDRQLGADEDWTLRHTLQNDPSIMLLATATSRFTGIDSPEQAMFNLFRAITLDPLASHECAALWHRLTGTTIDERQGRALEILTGGNPRLLTILSRIAADAPLHALAEDLTRLIDEQTAYFKGQIDGLSPQAQRVFVTLAELWSPTTAQDIAERARLPVNTVSSVLARLEQDGYVIAEPVSRRRKRYHLSERLYNIYYQMRRGGAAAQRVRYCVEFIAAYYDAGALVEKLLALAEETVAQAPTQREDSVAAFFALYDRIAASHAGQLLPRLPPQFHELPEVSDEQRQRLDADRERARGDIEWFTGLWREWWDSHRILREGWTMLVAEPVIGACWAELSRSMQGEAAVSTVTRQFGERMTEMAAELVALRPALQACCRVILQGEPSPVDVAVVGALATSWFADEPMFLHAANVAHARWPENPWVELGRQWIRDLRTGNHSRRFCREVKALLARHPDSVWLPLAAGLLLDIEDEPSAASSFYQASPLSGRLARLARTLVEIHLDVLDLEPEILREPRFAPLAVLLPAAPWIGFFVWLGRFTAERLARPGDAIEVLQIAAEHFLGSIDLQLALGSTLYFHASERADEGLAMLRRASKHSPDSWQHLAAIATIETYPLDQTDAAMATYRASWHAYLHSHTAVVRPTVYGWLGTISTMLPGHPLVPRFLSLLRPGQERLERDLRRLLALPERSRERQQELIAVILALATRGDAATLLGLLKKSPAAASLEPFVLALAMVTGETHQAPREIAETAHDVAAVIRVYAGLYQLVHEQVQP